MAMDLSRLLQNAQPSEVRKNVLAPTFGLNLAQSDIAIDPRYARIADNVVIRDGKVTTGFGGYTRFLSRVLGSPVVMIYRYTTEADISVLVIATLKHLYAYDEGTSDVVIITPLYQAGTARIDGGALDTVIGTGTTWTGSTNGRANVAAGDEIAFGATDIDDPDATWYEVQSVDSDTQLTLTTSAPGAIVDGPYTVRRVLNGDITLRYRADTFLASTAEGPTLRDVFYMTTQLFFLKWLGTNSAEYVQLNGMERAGTIAYHKNVMFYGDVTVAGERKRGTIITSQPGVPEETSNTLLGVAQFPASNKNRGQVLRLAQLRDTLACYSERSVSAIDLVGVPGDPVIWATRDIVPNHGLVAPDALVDRGIFHEFLSDEGVYRVDGVAYEEYADQIVPHILRLQFDDSRAYLTQAILDEVEGQNMWTFPETADPSPDENGPRWTYIQHHREPGESVRRVPFTRREYPATALGVWIRQAAGLRFSDFPGPGSEDEFQNILEPWTSRSFSGQRPIILMGTMDGRVVEANTGTTFDGAPINAVLRGQRWPADGKDGTQQATVWRVEPAFTIIQGLQGEATITMLGSFGAQSELLLKQARQFDFSQPRTRNVSMRTEIRWGALEISSTNVSWELAGYKVRMNLASER